MIRSIAFDQGVVVLDAASRAMAARCPACGASSTQVHDRYLRRPLGLPRRGVTVRLLLTARRFRCSNADCKRATFAEDFAPVIPRYARRTDDTAALLLRIALTAGGEAGARLAQQVGVPTSPDTPLRLTRQYDLPPFTTPRILGVDDFALRRG